MNEYAAFLLAFWKDLQSGFPDWKPPLEKPRKVMNAPNPFRPGELISYSTNEPLWLEPRMDLLPLNHVWWQHHDVFDGGGLTNIEAQVLVGIVLGEYQPLRDALFSKGVLDFLVSLPDEFVEVISRRQDIEDLAKQWSEAMTDPEHEMSQHYGSTYSWFSVECAMYWLDGITELAAMREEGESMFLYYVQ